MWYFSLDRPDGGEQEIALNGKELLIGRSGDNDIVIDDPSISRTHAKLRWDGIDHLWSFTDVGSRNGSTVGGVQIDSSKAYQLTNGQIVTLGDIKLRVQHGSTRVKEEEDDDTTTFIGHEKKKSYHPTRTVTLLVGRRRARNATLFFSFAMGNTFVYTVMLIVARQYSEDTNPWENPLMHLTVLLTGFASVMAAKWCGFSRQTLGITLRNWKVAVKEALVLCAIVIGVAALVKVTLIGTGVLPDSPMLHSTARNMAPTALLIYLVSALLQELMGRGILLAGIEVVYEGKHATPVAIVLSSLLFGIAHLFISITFFVITILVGLVLGALFIRHRNLIGVTLVHFLAGVAIIILYEPWLYYRA